LRTVASRHNKECVCGHDGLEAAVEEEVTMSIACHTEEEKEQIEEAAPIIKSNGMHFIITSFSSSCEVNVNNVSSCVAV
jgi:hypothetical protein